MSDLYRKVLVNAKDAEDGETSTVLELVNAGEFLILRLRGWNLDNVLEVWSGYQRDHAIESAVYHAEKYGLDALIARPALEVLR